MASAVPFQLLLVLDEPLPGILELGFEELVGAFREHLAIAQVLFDEHRREPLGHLRRDSRIVRGVADGKRVPLHGLDADVPPHLFDDVFHGQEPALLRIECEVLDDPLEACPTQNLLADRPQSILDTGRHRRAHERLGHPLSRAYALNYAAWLAHESGRVGELHRFVDALEVVAEGGPIGFFVAMPWMLRGRLLALEKEYDEAIRLVQHGLDQYHQTGQDLHRAAGLAFLAVTCLEAHDLGRASAAVDAAMATTALCGQRYFDAELTRLKGEIERARAPSETSVADGLLRSAMTIARRQGAPALEPIRMIKTVEEIALIRRAIALTEESIAATFRQLQAGVTERDVARLLAREMQGRGASGGGLVQFGAWSALPHGGPGGTALAPETVVLIDAEVFPGWMVAAIVVREFLVSGLRLGALPLIPGVEGLDVTRHRTRASKTNREYTGAKTRCAAGLDPVSASAAASRPRR